MIRADQSSNLNCPPEVPDCATQDKAVHQELLTAIREGLASAERGELKDAALVYAEMKAWYGIQG